MATSKCEALAQILHEAGFTWAGADELLRCVQELNTEGLRPDDVAQALLAWRRSAVRRRLTLCRRSAQHMLDNRKNRNGDGHDLQDEGYVHLGDDDSDRDQLQLFETIDEQQHRDSALAAMAAEAAYRGRHHND